MRKLDNIIAVFDIGLRTVFAPASAYRTRPQPNVSPQHKLTDSEKNHSIGLMRVNHVGEVCAQALYSGQALVSKQAQNVQALRQASREEVDHLAWCEQRIVELGGRKSLLNPLWYAGSFSLGLAAGLFGEQWNLGFLAETEYQVATHLNSHLAALPEQDTSSRAIVAQMKMDEEKHAETAIALGGVALPTPIKLVMRIASKVMTRTAYYV